MWAQFKVLSSLFINLSAGYLGLVFIVPPSQTNFLLSLKNLFLGAVFYYLAVKLEQEVSL
ncbi:hypothetical protein HY030_04605 [Candidatus Gottesmanbacteria bacterium]|nr:hypothetical protein [Candidatus Gottesmanbacteria bacterium]